MNMYFTSVASQPPTGHIPTSMAQRASKVTLPNNQGSPNKPPPMLANALNLFAGHSFGEPNQPVATSVNVTLRRNSAACPWGFRVQGGSDYKLQLTVCKTQSGSPSEGILHQGDAILSINGENTRNLSHEQATDKIRSSGTDLRMTVSRNQGSEFAELRPKGQIKFNAPQGARR
ncbi:unnamed protein product [Calicophoron daubneyi]|uniref:PDZ domain-containing protein n=1 Tax=Calicophoron daubneyi TaxID=300641 RepID=A0AAV2TB59_CALDB